MLAALTQFPEDADGLLQHLARSIDDDMLREIAEADRERDVAEHLSVLKKIRDEGYVPAPLQWEPKEVLELTRWSDPDNAEWYPGPARARAHAMRAFACAVLLRALGEPQNHAVLEGQNQTLIQLIESLEALGACPDQAAAAFLWWLLGRLPQSAPEEHAFYGIGLLWFALKLTPRVSEPALLGLLDWICEKEDEVSGKRREELGLRSAGRWLLDATAYNLRHAAWQRLGHRLMQQTLPGRSPELVDYVRLVGAMLAGA